MKQTWTMIELGYLEDLEVRENCLDAMRRVAYIKRPFWKLRYFWECIVELLKWMYWDFDLKREWFKFESTEEFQQAKQQKFADFKWLCNSERWIWEYTFRMEWFLGIWTTEKIDIELTSVEPDMSDHGKKFLRDELARHMELVSEKEVAEVEQIIDSVPIVFLKDVGVRKAQLIKRSVEDLNKVTLTLIEKEENI